MNDELFRITMY